MKKTLLCIAATAAIAAAEARAEGFVGAGAGSSRWPEAVCVPGTGCDRRDTAWSLRGGYMFNPYVGLEARYVDLGRAQAASPAASSGDARFESHGAGVGLALAFPIADAFRVTGAAGVARMKTSLDIGDVVTPGPEGTVTSHGFHVSETKSKPYYALGADYRFARDFSVGLEAARYRVSLGGGDDVDTIMASLTYRFR